jgi:hypothetical protein
MKTDYPRAFPERRETMRRAIPLKTKVRMLIHSDTFFPELGLSLVCIVFGLFLLFAVMTAGVNYPFLPVSYGEKITGAWLAILGVGRMWLLFKSTVLARKLCALLAFVTWLYLLSWVAVNDWHRLSIVFFFGAAVTSFWIFWRGPTEWPE